MEPMRFRLLGLRLWKERAEAMLGPRPKRLVASWREVAARR